MRVKQSRENLYDHGDFSGFGAKRTRGRGLEAGERREKKKQMRDLPNLIFQWRALCELVPRLKCMATRQDYLKQ